MFELFRKSRPFKIRSLHDNRKYGVAARNVKELLKKGCNILELPLSGANLCLYEDGTTVSEEFFGTLPDNTELVVLCKDQTWGGAVCDIAQLLNSDQHTKALVRAAKGLLAGEKSPKRQKILSDLLRTLEDRSELESRDEDEDWFRGVESRFKTKSAYLKYNCESRIRSYMKEGPFDQAKCASLHSINPYSSRESRILFSTWNLDHRIEKKRTIIPDLLEALQNHTSDDINLTYFYRLLFTRDNLKLVHIVCHKKEAHNVPCDPNKIFKRKHQRKKIRLK
ncbi:DNA fragmentation factor subunit beta isoform 2-T2 [Syngnathus typhle]